LTQTAQDSGAVRALHFWLLIIGFTTLGVMILAGGFVWRLDPVIAGSHRASRCIEPIVLLTITGVAAWLWTAQERKCSPSIDHAARVGWPAVALISVLAFVGTAFTARCILDEYPVSGDEYAYIFQSKLFHVGNLWAQPWSLEKYFERFYIFNVGDKVVTQYPPGWSAILAATSTAGISISLVNPILAASTIPILYLLGLRRLGAAIGLLGVCIFAGSGFFVMNSATFFNHPATALCGVLFALAVSEYLDDPRVVPAVGAGVTLSAIAAMRHYDAVLFALPAIAVLVWRWSWPHWRLVPLAVIGALPMIGGLLAYYWMVTGNPLQTPMTLVHPWDRLLGPNFSVEGSTEILFGRGIELAEWTSAPFFAVYLWALGRRAWRKELYFFELYGPIFPLGYWLYWSDGGVRWGPRYIYSAFPFIALTAAAAIRDALAQEDTGWLSRFAARAGILSIIISILQIPFLVSNAGRIVNQFEDVDRQVAAAKLHNALVFVSSGTGEIWHQAVGNLVRNGLALDGDVIYAHAGDILAGQTDPAVSEVAIKDLHAEFPDRNIWVYKRHEGEIHGNLTAWEAQ
jgi:hypothetical protein